MKRKMAVFLSIVLTMTVYFNGVTFAGNGPNRDGMGAQIYLGSTMLYDGYNDVESFTAGAEYHKDTNTLTLTNYNSTEESLFLSEMGEDFKLEVIGTNSIAGIRSNGYGYGGSIEIIGTGKLIVNGDKKEGFSAPIAIDADSSASKLKVADTVFLEVYGTGNDNSLVELSKTDFSENAINLPKIVEIQKEKEDIHSTMSAYVVGEAVEYSVATNSSEPDKEYVYEKNSYENDGEEIVSYMVYQVKNDVTLGKCVSASDYEYYSGTPEGYTFTDNKTTVKSLVPLSLSEYRVEGEDTVYGIAQDYFSGAFTAYIISKSEEIGNVAIAVNGESDMTELPEKYQSVVKNSVYTYKVNGESFIYEPSGWTEPETTKETSSIMEPESKSADVVTPTTKEEPIQPSEETTSVKETTTEDAPIYTIEPQNKVKTKIKKVKAGKKKVTLKWQKKNKINGYQIQYSLKKSMKNARYKLVTKAGKTSVVIKKLKSKKTYFFKIRTYITVGKVKWYSDWSGAKKAKVK